MYVCMYVYIHTFLSCVYVCSCTWKYIYVHMYTRACIYAYIYICTSLYSLVLRAPRVVRKSS